MKVSQNYQKNLSFKAVKIDIKKVAKLGPEVARGIQSVLPEIEKSSKGTNVVLTTSKDVNGLIWLKIIAETKRTVGGFLGFGTKKGKSISTITMENNTHESHITRLAKIAVKRAKRDLIEKFDAIHSVPGGTARTAAREERKALKILNSVVNPPLFHLK